MNSPKHLQCLYITVPGILLNYLSLFVILYFLKTKFLFMLTSPFNEGKGDVWIFFNKALIYIGHPHRQITNLILEILKSLQTYLSFSFIGCK